ncbi:MULTISPECIES: tryptophan 2,3-dioxygenase family protein [unclassified Nostoc]|uniref:tryptophan 2,3-dioxygenase family protein n=1 Tax=unclassified Nostoc TaxID=2593658 RepID=UPI002AD3966E|nr:tryptophan 2,3-dioxygenase family protein [Nostoc sp. DedQUE03]MDZ7973372.1 tryptophan 2,3-dioxygenase family protein [Nostoc sp. DedQUE03]MDZ8045353.1 tryptophan 2,3-dioxygenase family protein [Nostoc sp. DedQUE02]
MNEKLERVINLLKERYGDRFLDYMEGTALQRDLHYDDYIKLETLLSIQKPITDYHDEMTFLVYHQQTELWFRLIIHEGERAIRALSDTPCDITNATNAVERINHYFSTLINSFNILIECFSTQEFLIFRKALGSASGFQSTQFRIIEILAGLERKASPSESSGSNPENHETRNQVLPKKEKFYWENLIADKQQLGGTIPNFVKLKNKDVAHFNFVGDKVKQSSLRSMFITIVSQRLSSSKDAVELFETLLTEGQEKDLIELAENLLKMDVSITDWKRMHLKVSTKHLAKVSYGTAGSDWVKYLNKSIAEQRYFPELYLANQKLCKTVQIPSD